ncbi:LemA family protein [candidate division WOR-3 bacterium]|nr:LemA family protein [candidate division WOR-3 bacterium]
MLPLLVVVGIVVLLALIVVGVYNGLVRGRNQVRNGWHQIDVQLKRRIDLIPNLVETVRGYASHEKAIFEKMAEARAMAMSARGPAEAAKANNMLSDTLKSLFAVAEAYPDLKANQNFLQLQEELTATENKISFARQFYNDVVMVYNNQTQMFPSTVIAGMFNFRPAEFYTVPEAEREAPRVKF